MPPRGNEDGRASGVVRVDIGEEVEDLGAWRDGYVLWNNRLLETFFSPASRGEEVWLQVDKDELDSIGRELGGDEGFLRAVKAGPPWGSIIQGGRYVHGTRADFVARARGLVRQRRQRARRPSGYCDPGAFSSVYANCSAPTYLPFLAALVRSSASAGKDGFYAHLRDALGLDPGWGTQNLVALEQAWEDLAEWAKDERGRFGRYVFRRLGGYERIGVPASQCILSRRDRHALPLVFQQVGARSGQELSGKLLAAIKHAGADSGRFSTQFRDALARPELGELVSERIKAAFEDWDGLAPMPAAIAGVAGGQDALDDGEAIELCLTLGEGATFPWRIHWRVPALLESGNVVLKCEGAHWEAHQLGPEPTTTMGGTDDATQSAALRILAESAVADVEFVVSSFSGDADEGRKRELNLRKSILRILVWRYDQVSGRHELRESSLPSNGPAYLLATGSNANRLTRYLDGNPLGHEYFETAGLPEGWLLACIPDCSKLDDEQRATLPDGLQGRSRPRAVRLVGGRSITRGGARQYVSYDLPFVELDGPQGATLEADGLDFEEEVPEAGAASAIRRFRIKRRVEGAHRYDIVAVHGGEQVGAVRLRVASNAGEWAAGSVKFNLDRKGWPSAEAEGLRGVLLGVGEGDETVGCQRFEAMASEFGRLVAEEDLAKLKSRPAAMFLSTLAQLGSMAYPQARDHLARLLAKAGQSPDGRSALFDLRARGHLEVETDAEGHMARIHAVEPALYELAATNGGATAYGVLGTLRLQQWQSLLDAMGDGAIYQSRVEDPTLADWHVLPGNPERARDAASQLAFALHRMPAPRISAWAASVDDVRESIARLAGESVPGKAHSAEVFSAASGLFKPMHREARLDQEVKCQLFRMPDLHAERLNVYVLGMAGVGGARYGHVRDSSWGKWIALGAFARYVKDEHGISDASPWPIPYSIGEGIVWLPAQVKLPLVLERALVLCSGSPPELVEMEGASVDGSIELSRARNGTRMGHISPVYQHMTKGKWLGYRWVPLGIAQDVASKVGGVLAAL